ncbi:Flp pilus assembly protein CpaB [Caenispirillum salinarum]|uniref:Flp pilus assembly protein CpaB n=1 Tax=Caenispirillum salinarum TaxID=859058 RepID=UPI003850F039
MRMRSILVLGLAVALGTGSVFLARQWVEGNTQVAGPSEPAVKLTGVVVARVPLHFGNTLAEENLRVVRWPAETLPDGAFTSIEALLGGPDGENRVVLRGIEPGEPVLASKVSGFGGRATLSSIIANDMRAVTIRVNDVNGVAGFVLPGDRVDVILTRTPDRDEGVTDILLQNVKVLGVDQQASEKNDDPVVARAVTLEVTPVQAQKLTLGQTVGQLSLALRNVLNVNAAAARQVTLTDLGVPEPPKAEPEAAPAPAPVVRAAPAGDGRPTVRVVRGLESSEQKVSSEPRQRAAPPAAAPAPAPAPRLIPAPAPERAPAEPPPALVPRGSDQVVQLSGT